jgi:hypothetical protein
MLKTACVAVLIACAVVGSGCRKSGSTATTDPSPSVPPPGSVTTALQTLSTKAIYFGHQSVGYNIMDGVQALVTGTPGVTLRIEGTSDPAAMRKGVFAHAGNGSNGDPAGKIAAFQASVQGGIGAKVDIAFFKFCYVDFDGSTDVASLFANYRAKMTALKSAYPTVRFVHFTVPLTTGPAADNAVRERFSDLIRSTYSGAEPVFDLAKTESTRPDGSTEMVGGVRALAAAYSSDGGHLNSAGQDAVARALALYLATL